MNDINSDYFPDSGLPRIVENEEDVVRFLKDSNYFNSNGVTHYSFRPAMNSSRGRSEVSIFRYQGESLEHWKSKNREFSKKEILHGIAKIRVNSIRSLDLEVEADDNPPAHANIIGWDKYEDRDINKGYQKLLSIKLAKLAEKILYAA